MMNNMNHFELFYYDGVMTLLLQYSLQANNSAVNTVAVNKQ